MHADIHCQCAVLMAARAQTLTSGAWLQTNFNRSENYPDPSLYSEDVSYNLTCNCLLWTDNPCQGEIAYVSA